MKEFALTVRFETVSPEKVKAFVNDCHIGNVSIRDILNKSTTKTQKKLVFRCNSNPFKNIVPNFDATSYRDVESAIADEYASRALIPIVIRNYLRNTGFLYAQEQQAA